MQPPASATMAQTGNNGTPNFSLPIVPDNVPMMLDPSTTPSTASANGQSKAGNRMAPNAMQMQMMQLQQQLIRMQQMQQMQQPGYMMNAWNGPNQVI